MTVDERVEYMRGLLMKVPNTYPDFYNRLPKIAYKDGVLDDLIEYVEGEENLTPSKVITRYLDLTGQNTPLKVV